MLGLTQAARGWDSSRGVSFEGYARIRINGAVLDELRERDWASRSVRAEARRVHEATEELTATLGRAPGSREIAEHLGVRVDVINRLSDDLARATVLSYEDVCADPHGPGAAAVGIDDCPAELLVARELRSVLGDAVASLPERLRKVVIDYFFEERPMQEIADDLGVTESRVSQMRAEALALLRDGVNSQLAPEEVDHDDRGGRVGRRKAAYYAAIAGASTAQDRFAADVPLPQRVASLNARPA
jgi:RNA polymerase sigma factor for flagellar operon FliA